MKTTLLFILISALSFGQISPYYGEQEVYASQYQYRQMTYYDLAAVESNLHFILHNNLKLNQVDSKENLKDDVSSGTITTTYSTSVGRDVYRMQIKYDVALFEDQHIVKSMTVSGSPYLVTKFYLMAWRTKIQEGDLKKNELVKNYYLQDDISYQFHNGKPVITIKNRQFQGLGDFAAFREGSKASYISKYGTAEPLQISSADEQKQKEASFEASKKLKKKEELDAFKQRLNQN
ncbi:hypothetical protein [Epilithonimonas mollis]|uniref:DUF4468 domain-containing protein n=1 Tax=Epilithonimonas mollis TaxID=216903 RepID=A0A1M6UJX4_9FLAO|nr:hypothetical protein [Epilithonimonas mollis]SHK69534.1 hypothetical protein SAMN05444371_3341 [Epilithonimonas mollis]